MNRGTAPARGLSLLRLRELDPDAAVAIFPSDHHFADENAFAADLETAFETTEVKSDRIILLGVMPDYAETAYGWVEPGAAISSQLPNSVCQVSCFGRSRRN